MEQLDGINLGSIPEEVVGGWATELTLDMIEDGVWKRVAEKIGTVNLCKMFAIVGGATIYIPKLESALRPVRDIHIKEEFDGSNHLELAQKYNVSDRLVRYLCGPPNCEGQIDFFSDAQNAQS